MVPYAILFTTETLESKPFTGGTSSMGLFLASQVALLQTAIGTRKISGIEIIDWYTMCIWLKQRVRRQFLNLRVMELFSFEELLRTDVFIKGPFPFIPVKPHNLFGESLGFRRAIRYHVLWALYRVLGVLNLDPPILRSGGARPFMRTLDSDTLRPTFFWCGLLIVDVQGLLVFRAAVVLGDGVS